jgi:choline dehydrogenase-like flavoprotein
MQMLKPPKSLFETDVCIVGTGPAGMTLARELSKFDLRICLLESGGQKPDPQVADLNTGEVESIHGYRAETLYVGRRRQLGGTSNIWRHTLHGRSGKFLRCLPLDEIDFERRDWIPLSGWPFSRCELTPFYVRACQTCGIGPFGRTANDWQRESAASQPWQTDAFESVVSQFGEASVFKIDCLAELKKIANVSIFPGSVLLNLNTDDQRPDMISSVEAVQVDGRRFVVKARFVVLAAGGVENARILLLNEATRNGGPGNQHDMVGRCFMDHPSIELGKLIPSSGAIYERATFYDQHFANLVPIMGMLHLRPVVMRREKLLNACAVLVPHFANLRWNLPAVIKEIAAKGPRNLMRRFLPEKRRNASDENLGEQLSLRQYLLERYYTERRSGWSRLTHKARRFGSFGVRSLVEQSPDPANRIVLGDELDCFGQRRVKVYWRWSELDLHSIRRTQEIFREEFASAGIGAFTPTKASDSGMPRVFCSPHHFMGATRMHDDPHHGVVDPNCRIHGLQNLFIAGSSVFPTGGFANPTLTVIALALRLADHLRGLFTETKSLLPKPESMPAAVDL